MRNQADTPPEPGRDEERAEFHRSVKASQRRNFLGMLFWDIAHRQGWLFKTESLVVSTLALKLGASEAVLGLFPFISRMGKFVPPVIAGRSMEPLKRKLGVTLSSSLAFALMWVVLGAALMGWGQGGPAALWFFFAMYAVSWFVMGVVMIGIGTLRGKLIRPDLRGRLYGWSQMAGGLIVMLMLLVLADVVSRDDGVIPGLLGIEGPAAETFVVRYGVAFVLSGLLFLVAFAWLLVLREPPLSSDLKRAMPVKQFALAAWELLRDNADFRRVVALRFLLNILFACIMFYASFGRECIGMETLGKLVPLFLAIQTISRSVTAMVAGWVADRAGNRLVIRALSVVFVVWPLAGVLLGPHVSPEDPWLWVLVYVVVGFIIPAEPITQNYILEVTPIERHATSLGVANVLLAGAAFAPLVVGPLISVYGHSRVFMGLAVTMLPAIYFSMRLGEPRFAVEPRREPPPLG